MNEAVAAVELNRLRQALAQKDDAIRYWQSLAMADGICMDRRDMIAGQPPLDHVNTGAMSTENTDISPLHRHFRDLEGKVARQDENGTYNEKMVERLFDIRGLLMMATPTDAAGVAAKADATLHQLAVLAGDPSPPGWLTVARAGLVEMISAETGAAA